MHVNLRYVTVDEYGSLNDSSQCNLEGLVYVRTPARWALLDESWT